MPLINFYPDIDDKELIESIVETYRTKKIMVCSLLSVSIVVFIFISIYNGS